MHSFIALTVATTFSALTAALPHARTHLKFHAARGVSGAEESALIAARQVTTPNIKVDAYHGTCGESSGFGCAPGFCCSQWGYCGKSEQYCGSNSTSPIGTGSTTVVSIAPTSYSAPAYSAQASSDAPVSVSAAASSAPASSQEAQSSWVSPTLPSKATTFVPSTTYAATSTAAAAPSSYAPAPSQSAPSGGSSSGLGDVYKMYSGSGDVSAGWPAEGDWMDWDSMWSANSKVMGSSCSQFGQADNSDQETNDIKSAIQSAASSSGLDPRFILAVVMQESGGCVRAPTTNYGVTNPGLMQSHDGSGSCNNGGVQDPCPESQISQMINDGATGTSAGDGLQQTVDSCGASDVSKYYKGARIYNSGSIDSSGNLDAGIATHCYSSDIANRLTGWVDAASACTLD